MASRPIHDPCAGARCLLPLLAALVGPATAGCGNLEHGPSPQTQSQCAVCHQVDYDQTAAPPHVGSCGATMYSFPTTCGDCHGTVAWLGAVTDHAWWPLTGAHQAASCDACHGGTTPEWACLPSECLSCHLDVYETMSPHPGDGVTSTTCQDCHSTSTWEAQHPEPAFPIQTGPHEGIACASCHNPSLGSSLNGANTDCVGCHTLTQTDDQHGEVSAYFTARTDPGGPHFCLECHPDGRNGD